MIRYSVHMSIFLEDKMRLVKTEYLKEGEIIGEDLFNDNGAILLKKASIFREGYREHLKKSGVQSLFIDDALSKGVEPVYAMSKKLRESIVRDIKKAIERTKDSFEVDTDVINKISNMIVEEISHTNLVCELVDLKTNGFEIYEHSIGVAIMANMVGRKLNLTIEQIQKITTGALLHDIGKLQLPQNLWSKEMLSLEEEELVKTHTDLGYNSIKDNLGISPVTKLVVLCHHEREDGSGYPLGKEEDLHIGAKIVAVCDYFHNLIMKGLPLTHIMLKGKAEKFDLKVRRAVESILAFYPVGSLVKLSMGDIAIVEKNFAENLHRPQVRLIKSLEEREETNIKINLQEEENITIVSKIEDIEEI